MGVNIGDVIAEPHDIFGDGVNIAAQLESIADLGGEVSLLFCTGLMIVDPPWTLAGELKTILPELEKPLGQGGAGRFRLETPKP